MAAPLKLKYFEGPTRYPEYCCFTIIENFSVEDLKIQIAEEKHCPPSQLAVSMIHQGIKTELCDSDIIFDVLKPESSLEIVRRFGSSKNSINLFQQKYLAKLGFAEAGVSSMNSVGLSREGSSVEENSKDFQKPFLELKSLIVEGRTAEFIRTLDKLKKEWGPTIEGSNGWNCLHYACYYARASIVAHLLKEKHMSSEKPTSDNWSPIHIACAQGHFEIVKFLTISSNVNLNLCLPFRGTPLHCAVLNNHILIVSYLLNHHVNVRLTDQNGKTPLEIASHEKIVTMLKNANEYYEFKKTLADEKSVSSTHTVLYAPPLSPIVSGSLLEETSDLGTLEYYFVLNPIDGVLTRHKTRGSPFNQQHLLSSILCVWPNTKTESPFGFSFKTRKHIHHFFSESNITSILWVDYLTKAIEFSNCLCC